MLKHEHLIVRAELLKPPGKAHLKKINNWFADLIHSIGMNPLLGPFTVYCETAGNKGLTGICAIETSSITMHVWDEDKPGVMQLDIYTCSTLDISIIFDKLQQFKPTRIQYVFIDRDEKFEIKDFNEIVYPQNIERKELKCVA